MRLLLAILFLMPLGLLAYGLWDATRRRRFSGWLIGGLASAVMVYGPAVLMWWLFSGLVTTVSDMPQARLEKVLGFALPPDATGLRSHYSKFGDFHLKVRFEIPPASEPKVWDVLKLTPTASTPNQSISQAVEMHNSGRRELSWWQPEAAKSFRYAKDPPAAGEYWRVLIDTSDPQRYVVYIEGFST